MSELIPKLKRGSGGGYESRWMGDTKPNWLVKIIHDNDKNETQIKIVHNTPTHVGEVVYLGDEGICAKRWDCDKKDTCNKRVPFCEDITPIFQCKVCKRKSNVINWRWLFLSFIKWHVDRAIKDNSKIIIAPPLTVTELTKLLKGEND